MNTSCVKIGADGAHLPLEATEFVAVLDTETKLMWAAATVKARNWTAADDIAKKTEIGGFGDWHLPSRRELLSIVDDTRYNPAIDTAFFPNCPSDWFWTSTPAAPSPGGYAWYVYFYYGLAGWLARYYNGFVRAVRASQS